MGGKAKALLYATFAGTRLPSPIFALSAYAAAAVLAILDAVVNVRAPMPTEAALREDDNPRDEIARLEAVIEEAAEAAERCRKLILAGKLSAAVGAVWLLGATLGPLNGLASLAGGTAAFLGGIVAFGSNTMTARQIAARIAAAEAARAQLIDGMALQPVAKQD